MIKMQTIGIVLFIVLLLSAMIGALWWESYTCEPLPTEAVVVAVWNEPDTWGEDWRTSVRLPNGLRIVKDGQLGKPGETIVTTAESRPGIPFDDASSVSGSGVEAPRPASEF